MNRHELNHTWGLSFSRNSWLSWSPRSTPCWNHYNTIHTVAFWYLVFAINPQCTSAHSDQNRSISIKDSQWSIGQSSQVTNSTERSSTSWDEIHRTTSIPVLCTFTSWWRESFISGPCFDTTLYMSRHVEIESTWGQNHWGRLIDINVSASI